MGHPDLGNTMGGDCQNFLPAFFPSPDISKIAIAVFIPQPGFFLQAVSLPCLTFHDDPVRKDSLSMKAIFPPFHDGIKNSKPIEVKGVTRKEMPEIEADRIFLTESRQSSNRLLPSVLIFLSCLL